MGHRLATKILEQFKYNIMNYKWLVTFCLPGQGSKMFKEIIEANQWSHAKALLEAKYAGIVIKNHTTIK